MLLTLLQVLLSCFNLIKVLLFHKLHFLNHSLQIELLLNLELALMVLMPLIVLRLSQSNLYLTHYVLFHLHDQ
jgi:hypothetical protein